MPAAQLSWTQIRSPQILDRLFLSLLISFSICPSYAHTLPVYVTRSWPREEAHAIQSTGKKGESFPRDFATAVGIVVLAVTIGTTLICVFAHCWRRILEWGWGDNGSVTGKSKRKGKEAWFCGADRGLPMPQFDILEPESEPLALSMQAVEPDWDLEFPGMDGRNIIPGTRTKSKAHWNNSGATLPSWLDLEEIERPASAAYLLDRP
ncbi:hypothetical protein F5B21DRAFT_504325 [Xylaria acuta]|nr:hypothetical protein F5B21DRAFT_504325 [Xylaria acuta]